MKKFTKSFMLLAALVLTLSVFAGTTAEAAKKKKPSVTKVTSVNKLTGSKTITLAKGKKATLKTTVTVKNTKSKAYKAVTYSSSNKKIATVSKSGKITAKKTGKATIKVTSKKNKKKYAKVTVKVVSGKVTKVTLNKTAATLRIGATETLKATPKTSGKKPNKTVKWTSSNTKVATVSSKGVVKAVAPGTATIKATATDGSGQSASAKITVKNNVTSIKFTTAPAKVAVGATVTAKAEVNADAYDTTVTYSIDPASQEVATVDPKTGAIKGVARGTVNVVAKAADGKTATIKVTVYDAVVTKVTPTKDKTATTTIAFAGKVADVEKDILGLLKDMKADSGEKFVKVNGVDKKLAYNGSAVTVDDKALSTYETTEGTVSVVITEKFINYVNALQVAQVMKAGNNYNKYTVTVGKHVFKKVAVDASYITVTEKNGKTYTAYVEGGSIYFVGNVKDDLVDLADKGIATIE